MKTIHTQFYQHVNTSSRRPCDPVHRSSVPYLSGTAALLRGRRLALQGKSRFGGHQTSQILNLTSRSAHETRELRSIKAPPSQLFPSRNFAYHLSGRRSFDRCRREFLKRPTLTATRAHFLAHGDRGLVVASIARGPKCRFLMDSRPCNRRPCTAQIVAGRYSIWTMVRAAHRRLLTTPWYLYPNQR